MIGDLFDSPWKILIVAVVLIVLFGSKKLPDAARSLGKSMRIMKTEIHDLHGEDDHKPEPVKQAEPAPTQQQIQIAQLEQQVQDLRNQAAASEPVPASPPLPETQRTQQPG
jgi:sec-independent protein translocase protein TatA